LKFQVVASLRLSGSARVEEHFEARPLLDFCLAKSGDELLHI
jgi:hypothetical protein